MKKVVPVSMVKTRLHRGETMKSWSDIIEEKQRYSEGISTFSNKIKNELDDKILTLKRIIDKLGDFTDELVIHIADNSKKKVNDLTKELDDLIDSVKDY